MKTERIAMWCVVFGLAITMIAGTSNGHAADGPQVRTHTGPVRGTESADGIRSYKGIPYAQPPLGELRFSPPRDVEPWDEVRDCTRFGDIAMQNRSKAGLTPSDIGMSEDCLTLNVWTPAAPGDGQKLPVYVFIHGGAYATGSGAIPIYDGAKFARQGIVAVTINYRLNAHGFFASRETYNRFGTTGNWGHLDQIKALEWLRDGIAAFGGDPDNVTIGGESAGSYSVSALILSPLARGLFHGAIMESGTVLAVPAISLYAKGDFERSIAQGSMMSAFFGAKDDAEGLAKMRAADAGVLSRLALFSADQTIPLAFFLMPVFDGYVMPRDPVATLRRGDFNRVRLLFGFNSDEGTLFAPADTKADTYKMMVRMAVGDGAETALERFPVTDAVPADERTRRFLTYSMFTAGMKIYADAFAEAGLDVYAYNFDTATAGTLKAGLGATHALELPFVFDNLEAMNITDEAHRKTAREMHFRWANFIKHGDPNLGATPPTETNWPKYDGGNPRVLRFGEKVEAVPFPDREDMDFMTDLLFGDGR